MSEINNESLEKISSPDVEAEDTSSSTEEKVADAEDALTVAEASPDEVSRVEATRDTDETDDLPVGEEEEVVTEDPLTVDDEESSDKSHGDETMESDSAEAVSPDEEDLDDEIVEAPLAVEVEEPDDKGEAKEDEVEEPTPNQVADQVQVEVTDDGRLWYVVHCYSGYENKVRHNLEQRIDTMGMKGKIFDVVVPTEEEIEIKDGKRRTVERRVFPGYILVQMIMAEDSWYVVRNTPGVTGFVGMGNEPTPLRPEEVNQIVKRMEADAPRVKVSFATGQKVRIIDGPFNDFIGTVSDINMERAKVRVMVSFFGRETPVELDFLQVEKA
jgi:transcriptional antiterminator NusG